MRLGARMSGDALLQLLLAFIQFRLELNDALVQSLVISGRDDRGQIGFELRLKLFDEDLLK